MSRFEGIILDWAGTTVDFGCFAPVQAFIEGFKQFEVIPTIEEVRQPMGMSKMDHIRAMLHMPGVKSQWLEKNGGKATEADVQAIYKEFEKKLFESLADHAKPLPGVVAVVEKLRERGLKIGSTTGYTDEMMEIVVPLAKKNGYAPDVWLSPDAVGKQGRPYPYMIFKNMEMLRLKNVRKVLKVGDTAADIREGKNAGVCSAAIAAGSSQMGLTQQEYDALSSKEQKQLCAKTANEFVLAGADMVFDTIQDMFEFITE